MKRKIKLIQGIDKRTNKVLFELDCDFLEMTREQFDFIDSVEEMGLFKNIPERMRQLKPIKWEVLK
jgi:hypothetical protein